MAKLRNEHINDLNEDELSILWFCINVVSPKILNYEITPSLFTSIKHEALQNRLLQCEQFIKDEYKNIFNELKRKLEMPHISPPAPVIENVLSSSIEQNNNLNNTGSVVT
jgi:hypothetical protein